MPAMETSRTACKLPSINAPGIFVQMMLGLLVAIAPMQALAAKKTGQATMSVGITIVAAQPEVDEASSRHGPGGRIPVDAAHAIRHDDPLRDARVEQLRTAAGEAIKVVSY